MTSKNESLEKQISTFQGSGTTVRSCNEQSTPIYAAAASVPPPKDAVASPPSRSIRKPIQPDTREVNLILFGLSEQGSILDTKDVVDELLEFLAGKPMQIKDMFQLGKVTRSSGTGTSVRPRPILLKLFTAWDHKLVLLRRGNLRGFRISRLFLREDVPPEHRLRMGRHRPSTADSSSTTPDFVPLPANKTAPPSEASCDAASANRQLWPRLNSLVLDSGLGHFSRQSLSPTPLASADACLA